MTDYTAYNMTKKENERLLRLYDSPNITIPEEGELCTIRFTHDSNKPKHFEMFIDNQIVLSHYAAHNDTKVDLFPSHFSIYKDAKLKIKVRGGRCLAEVKLTIRHFRGFNNGDN